MLFYLIRHGDPIYQPDSLTSLGFRQAEAVAKRLALHGLERVYVSSSDRARQTAAPTCDLLNLQPIVLDWCHENHAAHYFMSDHRWFCDHPLYGKEALNPDYACADWYKFPVFEGQKFGEGVAFYKEHTFSFLKELGFDYDEKQNCYHVKKPVFKQVALFAHYGFSMSFLSTVLNIPYTVFSTRFTMPHTGVTILYFSDYKETVFPKVLAFSDTGHLYADRLPLKYNNSFYY